MKRSSVVQLTILSSVASTLLSCRSADVRHCVDPNQAVVDERNCLASSQQGFPGYYHWYYGGTRGAVPLGTRLTGGSASPSSATTRGGIGASGEAASGGHSSGGGEGGAGE